MDEDVDIATTIDEICEVNAGRAALYRSLAHYYFKELTEEEIEHVAESDFSQFGGDEALVSEGFEDMSRYLSHRNTGTRQELAVDYAHTFLAAGNYLSFAATPYESVFTSETGLLMQEARDDVYRMYCDEHIQPHAELQTPEDHLSFEFEFMATLLERQNEALRAHDWPRVRECAQRIREFHDNHQLNWIDDLCDAVMDVANTRFYRGVSKVTRGFVHLETDVISDVEQVVEELAQSPGEQERDSCECVEGARS